MELKSLWVTEPEEEYHAKKDIISASGLKKVIHSPAHYQCMLNDEFKTTPAMEEGKLIHRAILEPDLFLKTMVVAPKCDRRYKEGKEKWAKFTETLTGDETIVKDGQMDMLLKIIENIKAYPMVANMLTDSVFEVSGYWEDEKFGPCRMRADAISEKEWIFDIKKTKDAQRHAFERQLWKLRYDVSAAWYSRGFEAIVGHKPKGFAFIAIESSYPYPIYIYTADPALLECGQYGGNDSIGYEQAACILMDCRKTDNWPMPQSKPETISVPNYVL